MASRTSFSDICSNIFKGCEMKELIYSLIILGRTVHDRLPPHCFWFLISRMKFDPRDPLSTDDGRARLVDVLLETSMGGSTRMTQSGPENLPRRYLPPGRYSDLYRLYTAHCMRCGRPISSSTTFFRVLRESGWRDVLRFRGASTHAQCTVCHTLKSRMRSSRSFQSHAKACDAYMRHLAGTFADRSCYWQFRERSSTTGDMLTLIVDGMDKSKFLLPRYCFGSTPKALETRQRPAMWTVGRSGSWMGGVCIPHGFRAVNWYRLGLRNTF